MKKLRLSRETLRNLASSKLRVAGVGTTGNNLCSEGWTCAALTGCQQVGSTRCDSGYQTVCDCPIIL